PFILGEIKAPVYGTGLTLGLIREKLKEFGLDSTTEFRKVKPRDKVSIGPFDVEFIRVCHSIVDGTALAITTPVGVIIHTGDFKLDQTPVDGEILDYARFAEYGERGVRLLLSDSTNVERTGFTVSEREVGATFEDIFRVSRGRIIVAAFSSNIHRVQQVMDVAAKCGKKVILNGRSMVNNARIARELGYLKVPDGLIMDFKELNTIAPNEAVLLTTGSQGEPMSALTRMAMDDHKQIKILKGDTVILSSRFIPGNEKAISTMMNHLYRRGAEVIYEKVSEIHVSGHASQEELKIMMNLVKPACFVPVHGECRHLVKHTHLARKMGIVDENIVLAEDGDIVEVTAERISLAGRVSAGKIFVDGKGVGDVGNMVLRERKHLSQDGMVIALIGLNEKSGEVIFGPEIITKGLVFEEDSAHLLDGAKEAVLDTLSKVNVEAKGEALEVKEEVRRALRRFFNRALERRPIILPLIIEM
ncbi:MAG: ribonuclease J, partial [Thermodesulfobacteriota bacterium]